MISESRREIMPGVEIVVRGEDVESTDAVLAEVILELAAEAGGEVTINVDDPETMETLARRLREKGVDPISGQWLC